MLYLILNCHRCRGVAARLCPTTRLEILLMRTLLTAALAVSLLATRVQAQNTPTPKQAPKIVLQSPDGKMSYDLAKLYEKGPVLIRLTCACTGCDAELKCFQKLQDAYDGKGLQTIAVFRERAESLESYVVKKNVSFMWLADPKGELWKTFDAKAMPTNILVEKGGKVVRVVNGCTPDGRNAQVLSEEISRLLAIPTVQIAEPKTKAK
jgi:peroxiredoxin